MNSFLFQLILTEAVTLASVFVTVSTIPPGIKAALEQFIAAGQNLAVAIQAGK